MLVMFAIAHATRYPFRELLCDAATELYFANCSYANVVVAIEYEIADVCLSRLLVACIHACLVGTCLPTSPSIEVDHTSSDTATSAAALHLHATAATVASWRTVRLCDPHAFTPACDLQALRTFTVHPEVRRSARGGGGPRRRYPHSQRERTVPLPLAPC